MRIPRVLAAAVVLGAFLAPGAALPAFSTTTVVNQSFSTPAAPGKVRTVYAKVLWTGAEFGNGAAYSDDNLSAKDGSLRIALRNGKGGYVAIDPSRKGITHGHYRFSIKRTGKGTGYGVAVLLWPKGDDARKGEVDLIEGDLDKHQHIYHHAVGDHCRSDGYCPNVHIVDLKTKWSDWTTVEVDWTKDRLKIQIDGKTKLSTTKDIPVGPHALIVQAAKKPDATKVSDSTVLIGSVKITQH